MCIKGFSSYLHNNRNALFSLNKHSMTSAILTSLSDEPSYATQSFSSQALVPNGLLAVVSPVWELSQAKYAAMAQIISILYKQTKHCYLMNLPALKN